LRGPKKNPKNPNSGKSLGRPRDAKDVSGILGFFGTSQAKFGFLPEKLGPLKRFCLFSTKIIDLCSKSMVLHNRSLVLQNKSMDLFGKSMV
jgi:hypothetical protein